MTLDELNTSDEPSSESASGKLESVDWGLIIFLALGVVAVLVPHISIPVVGLYWASIVAVGILVLWGTVMPTTCMSGGLVCSLVAMVLLFNTVVLVLAAIIRFVLTLFA